MHREIHPTVLFAARRILHGTFFRGKKEEAKFFKKRHVRMDERVTASAL